MRQKARGFFLGSGTNEPVTMALHLPFIFLLLCAVSAQQPEQVHLSLSGKGGEMVVEFVAHNADPQFVYWATSPSNLVPPSMPTPPNTSVLPGYDYGPGYLVDGYDLYDAPMTVDAAAAWCRGNASCAGFTFANTDPLCGGAVCHINFKSGLEYAPAQGWQTFYLPPSPVANVSTSAFDYNNATLGAIGWMHTGVLTGLLPNTTYYYICGSPKTGWSMMHSFKNEPQDRAPIFAVFADFG